MNPLLDNDFLVQLNRDRNRTIYARIISLNQFEHPIEQIEGVVTAGSITIDGKSAVRRICSLTLSAKNLNINNVYWGLETKVKIEIGLQNNVDDKYDDIIWFKQGLFLLTDFKTTQVVNNYTINLTGKDKMCLLNGDISGVLPAPHIFDSYDVEGNATSSQVGEDGTYNFFTDSGINEFILAGLNTRYSTDYEYIRLAGKIISLTYRGGLPNAAEITFSVNPVEPEDPTKASALYNWVKIKSLTSSDSNPYVINIGDNDITGFQVRNVPPGTTFEWELEQKIPITLIIQEMVHQYGQERYSNIIIRDIDPYALEMLDNRNDSNYYLLHNGTIYDKFIDWNTLKNNYKLYLTTNSAGTTDITDVNDIIYRNYVEEDDTSLIGYIDVQPTKIIDSDKNTYTVLPVNSYDVAGYGMTLLVYPDELKANTGDTITSVLDKIVNFLGNYEYFYDLDGQFVFQAKPAYVQTPWNNTIYLKDENYVEPSELYRKVSYTFDDAVLTPQYQNTPNLNNIKNDFIIWGERKTSSSNTIIFHGRYAIDNIPLEYTDFNGYTWTSNKVKSLINNLLNKIQSQSAANRTYDYPELLNDNWWEIHDWSNYYTSAFDVDLYSDANLIAQYSKEAGSIEGFSKAFDFENTLEGTANTIIVVYTDTTKTTISQLIVNPQCYYYQLIDLRLLNDGWDYLYDNETNQFLIVNTLSPSRVSEFKARQVLHPDYITTFIYDPVLPQDFSELPSNLITELLEPKLKNENGKQRKYALAQDVDWRHLLHVMADDWYAHNHEDDFEINLRKNNSWPELDINLFPYGRTGYEQYYLDFTSIGGPWSGLYNIFAVWKDYYESHSDLISDDENDYNTMRYNQAKTICNDENYLNLYYTTGSYKYWNKDVIENPEKLLFWFDFFPADKMGIGKFAVSVIGDRPKTVNDTNIKVIIYRDAPDVIYCTQDEYTYYENRCALKTGYKYIIIDNEIKSNFVRSIRGRTVHEEADNMLYQYSYFNDTVNISSVPIYYLQPNTLISVKDDLSKIIGYYIMNKIDISLAYNGMMQIGAIKAPERIY